jgi:hypothetical protein
VALDPLATAADLTARNITFDATTEATLVNTFLAEASAAVREAAGCPISQATSTVTLVGEFDDELRLPGPPVQSVSAVEVDGFEVTDWRLVDGSLYRWGGWRWACPGPSLVSVTYTHGLPEMPEDIVGYVCVLVAGALRESRESDDGTGIAPERGVTSERIDDYSVSIAPGEQPSTPFEIPDAVRLQLAARFGGGVMVVGVR